MKKRAFSLFLAAILVLTSVSFAFAGSTYTVKSGDVLWKIAQKYNTTWKKLAEINKMKNPNLIFPGQVIQLDDAASQAAPAASGVKNGKYEASAAGKNGNVTVAVTVANNKIEKVEIVKHDETPGISDPAIQRIPKSIVDGQTLAVDTISGATVTSKAILAAAEASLVKAGMDVTALKVKKTQAQKGEKIEKTADVIVIGGGGAGMAAAASAAQNGAKVILIEKTAALGGNTLASGFAWNAVNPEVQGKMKTLPGQLDTLKGMLKYDEKDFGMYGETLKILKNQINTYLAGDTSMMFDSQEFHMIQMYLGGKRQDKDGNWIVGDFDLVKTVVANSLPAQKWMQSLGLQFAPQLSSPVGSMWTRAANPVKKSDAFDIVTNYVTKIVNNGSEIMLETKANELIVESGRVTGVKAARVDGTEVILHARNGVVMATGGYGANAKMVAEYDRYWPSIPLDMKTTCVSTVTGDGIVLAKKINANLIGMAFTQLMPTANAKTGGLADSLLPPPQNYVFVNKEGKRFVNEYAERDVLSFAALKQTGGMFYSINDVEMAKKLNNKLTLEQVDAMVAKGLIYKADTLEGLAKIIGCDPTTLVEEMKKYNTFVKNGKDTEFGKNVFDLPVEKGPFYASPCMPAIHHTMGGVQINTQAQVIDTNGKVIPSFYAAGECTGGINGGNRLGGNSIANIFVFGKIAGESAAKSK